MNVFVTGFPRGGTTLLCLMMNCFNGCRVFSDHERHPQEFKSLQRKNNPNHVVLKQPFGYYEDFPPPYNYESVQKDYGAKIISLVRDPRDVGVSVHPVHPGMYWVPFNIIIRNCEEYLKHLNDPNVLFVRYEDLVINTRTELDRISKFIDRSYKSDFMNFYKHPHANLRTNRSLGGPRPIDTNSIGEWELEENKERVKEIMSSDIKKYIKELGYDEGEI